MPASVTATMRGIRQALKTSRLESDTQITFIMMIGRKANRNENIPLLTEENCEQNEFELQIP